MKLKFFCNYIAPLSAECALNVIIKIKVCKMCFQGLSFICSLGIPSFNWTIPTTDYKEPLILYMEWKKQILLKILL